MFFLNTSKELNLKNSAYRKAVQLYVWKAYLQDLSKGDPTTRYFVPKRRRKVTAAIAAKESGVLAGILEAEWFRDYKNVQVSNYKFLISES